jgi:predicted Zn-dependent protease
MSDIFEEVVNDHLYEKRVKFFKKLLLVASICTVIAVITLFIRAWYFEKEKENNIRLTENLLNKTILSLHNDTRENISYEVTENLSGGRVRELLALEEVAAEIYKMNFRYAQTALQSLIENHKISENTKNFARMSWMSIELNKKQKDQDVATFAKYATSVSSSAPFAGTIGLMYAIMLAGQGNKDEALKILSKISSSVDSTQALKLQADALIENLENNS